MSLLGDTLGWSRDEQTLSFHKAKDMTEITEAVDVEEALRLAEVGEYLYDKKAFSAGNGYDEPREFSICWDWQQSKPNEYGQGVLLAEAVAWHREMAADGIETQANKLRAELTRLQEEVKGLRGEDQIKTMTERFLAWKLPTDFSPDCGISFKAEFNEHTDRPMRHEPSGTNLLNYTQAEAMVRYVVGDQHGQ